MNREHARRIYFEQIKRAVSLEMLLDRFGDLATLKGRGAKRRGCCPIHHGSRADQFHVDFDKNVWHCFGDCNRGGGIIEFVAEMERVDNLHAAQLIAGWFAIGPSTPHPNHRNQRRREAMSGGRPSHKAFVVEDKEEGSEEKAFWTRCGSAWPHKDGKGLNVQIASGLSVSGRLVLREYTDEDAKEEEQQKTKRRK